MNKSKHPDGINFIRPIPNSQYIVLIDGSVARLLKPTIKNDKKYFNIRIKGEMSEQVQEQ